MGIGKKIKQIREIRNFTQEYMANELNLSQAGYGKIERDLTDLSIKRLQQIAQILDVDYRSILDFDEKTIINMYNNNNANAIVKNQQIVNDPELLSKIDFLAVEISNLRKDLKK